MVYQAANSEEELRRIHLPRTPVNKGKGKPEAPSKVVASGEHAVDYVPESERRVG